MIGSPPPDAFGTGWNRLGVRALGVRMLPVTPEVEAAILATLAVEGLSLAGPADV